MSKKKSPAPNRSSLKPANTSNYEKDLLLSLNNDFASLSERKDFLKTIWPKLEQLFGCKNVFICFLENDALKPILRIADESKKNHSGYVALTNSDITVHDGFLDTVLKSNVPCVSDLEAMRRRPNPPEYIGTLCDVGFKSSLSKRLSYGNNQLGMLTFWSENKYAFTPHHVELMELLVPQISIVIANVLASDSLRKRQAENEQLHIISNEIASIRDKNDLARILSGTLKSCIGFEEATILIYNTEKQSYNVYVYEDGSKRATHPQIKAALSADYPLFDTDLSSSHIAKVQNVKELMKNEHPAASFIAAAGIQEIATIKLVDGSQLIGLFVLLSQKTGSFSTTSLHLMQRISFQISTAVAKLVALQNLQNRERENEILLAIGRQLSFIRKKEDLLPLLKKQLDQLSFYTDVVIAKVDRSKKTFSGFLVNEDANEAADRLQHPGYPQMRDAHHVFPDGVFEVALQAKEPVTFDINEIVRSGKAPSYIKFIHENGTVEMVAVSLRDRNKEIGALFCFTSQRKSFTKLQLSLVQAIGDQLGTAVANLLANEEILTREKEKSILLSLSREIAAVRNKHDLFQVVIAKVKELFSIEQFGIGLINEDGKTESAFLVAADDAIKKDPIFDDVISRKYPIHDGIFDVIMKSDEPVTFIVKQLEEPLPYYADYWKKIGIESITGIALRMGQTNLGALFFHLDPSLYNYISNNLLKGVCAQLSIAISNIQANERIQRQLEEISSYKEQLEKEKRYLQEEATGRHTYSDIVGKSPQMQKVFHLLSQVAFTNSTILLLGETGTGKELIARAIHNSSSRKDKLMVKVNCASIPASLIESELFGHEKGSFTGAIERRIGKFELAKGGTIFLDEVGEVPLGLQAKLLRALQEKEIERVGGKDVIKVDIRIIAATNRNLDKEILEGKFRNDLYYRLNVFPITIPPLRERTDDIAPLAFHFMTKFSKNSGKKVNNISEKVVKELKSYGWPGNVRELEHLIERSVLMTSGDTIKEVHLPTNIKKQLNLGAASKIKTHEENERDHILHVLERCNGKVFGPGGAAEALGLKASTLNSKMKKLGIRKINPFETI